MHNRELLLKNFHTLMQATCISQNHIAWSYQNTIQSLVEKIPFCQIQLLLETSLYKTIMVIKPWLVQIIPSFHHNFHFFHKLSLNKYHSTSPFHRDFKSHNLKCASVCNTITSQFKQNLTLVCFFNHVPNSYHLLTQYSSALLKLPNSNTTNAST